MSIKVDKCLCINEAAKTWLSTRIDLDRSWCVWPRFYNSNLELCLKGTDISTGKRITCMVPQNIRPQVYNLYLSKKASKKPSSEMLKAFAYLGLKYTNADKFRFSRKLSTAVRSARISYLSRHTGSTQSFIELAALLYDKLPKAKKLPIQRKLSYFQSKS